MNRFTTFTLTVLLLLRLAAAPAAKAASTPEIDRETLDKWSAPYRGWHYQPEHVIPANPEIPGHVEFKNPDVPCVYQLPGRPDKWFMSFIGFNGKGYNSFVAESSDLVEWTNPRLAMGFGKPGEFDFGGCVIGAFLYESYEIKAPRILKKHEGRFWTLYGCYAKQGGYLMKKTSLLAALLGILAIHTHAEDNLPPATYPLGSDIPNKPYNPHTRGDDYKENFRPQFHFSPRSGWMNDINALVYQDGVYHMTYQWGRDIRHGGYATSTDLLHWEDKGVALVPQDSKLPKDAIRNMAGKQIYSGSGVLVSGETAKKITGADKPALVTHYTGTGVGTCIAWSNDQGATWNNYQGNPVAQPTPNADPRDPHVFWYEPTQSWILAIYEKGTTFYGSKDLLQWEHLSHIPFGFECPDIFELALDGDPANKKWVLHDADGKYIVGHFNGKEFLPEQNEPLRMDVGPDFYAAQTFFRPSLPVGKVIQIAWNDHWNGGVGEKGWERNATFPVEIGLVTDQGKMRVTRTPIKAIRKLYGGTRNVAAQTLGEKNVLADIQSKTFDLTATFDLTQATANRIVFRVANRTLCYDIARKALVGVAKSPQGIETEAFFELKPDSANLLVIRMLVDWCSIEVFANRGVFSYSENTALDPRDHSLELSSQGGGVRLLSLELNEVKSIWNRDAGANQTDAHNVWQKTVNHRGNLGTGDITWRVVLGNHGAIDTFTIKGGANIRAQTSGFSLSEYLTMQSNL